MRSDFSRWPIQEVESSYSTITSRYLVRCSISTESNTSKDLILFNRVTVMLLVWRYYSSSRVADIIQCLQLMFLVRIWRPTTSNAFYLTCVQQMLCQLDKVLLFIGPLLSADFVLLLIISYSFLLFAELLITRSQCERAKSIHVILTQQRHRICEYLHIVHLNVFLSLPQLWNVCVLEMTRPELA